MHKQKNMVLNDDGEFSFNVPSQRNRSKGCLKLLIFIFYTVVVIVVSVVGTFLSVEPLEDAWLGTQCDRTYVVDIVSNRATLRSRPSRHGEVVGFVEAGPRYIILDTNYNKLLNDCWAKIEVDGTKGWLLTLLEKGKH